MVQSEIDAIRTMLSSKPRPVGWAERRGRIDEVGSVWPVAEDIALTPVNAGGVPAEWSLAPGSDASRVLMFLHGGGYCSGSILSHRRMVTEAGRAAGMRTLAIGYRLAPEHPFPAALEDALAAWRFVLTQAIGAAHVAVGGDSAGGGLIGRADQHAAQRRWTMFPPARGWYRRGWTWRCPVQRSPARTRSIRLSIRTILTNWRMPMFPHGVNRSDPRVSPLFADLRGFPPTLIQVGSAETLLADATRLAAALGSAMCR